MPRNEIANSDVREIFRILRYFAHQKVGSMREESVTVLFRVLH